MIRVTALAFTLYPVTDLARARAFYEGVLGLKPATTWGDASSGWIEYDVGAATLAIANTEAGWKIGGGPAVALEVDDFPAAVATLRAAAVTFVVEPATGSLCSMAVFLDPDGNSLALHHRHAA